MAKNRYGWNKRIKEMARKMKQEEKLKRRQSKSQEKQVDEASEDSAAETEAAEVAEDSSVA